MSEQKQQHDQDQDPPLEEESLELVGAQEDPLTVLQRERDDFESKYLRSAADMQNYVRRAQQNLVDAREQQVLEIARSMVTILDHFDHALEIDTNAGDAAAVLKGMQIVRDEFLSALERYGVKRLDAKRGDPFDPNRHEAVMRETIEGVEADQIATQYQPGYTLGDKILRPAKVSITQ
jgi:molecular chaperone GrpE